MRETYGGFGDFSQVKVSPVEYRFLNGTVHRIWEPMSITSVRLPQAVQEPSTLVTLLGLSLQSMEVSVFTQVVSYDIFIFIAAAGGILSLAAGVARVSVKATSFLRVRWQKRRGVGQEGDLEMTSPLTLESRVAALEEALKQQQKLSSQPTDATSV
eukprot:CAMPEP_0175949082 /NCGR_PEP_ID=MMETSP0108-20121206/28826_1 /TAXON_ID=195067 ORGANISM="Goniomonas pacifica, Strain CCMP1869" /NCGR_SAMPLE_ID=MMETSP0108 /ASSEMBLY_ACC=CAM_ASM_000204 /LENGTH=155 /DNA_ID=CAMNT_0017274949 /DNA_START=434 /DNA_END=901 /DNA_ORIENTATION=-